MPLPGGATDKFGNRFELRWTVLCMTDVMREAAATIYLEPPGRAGDGVEFIMTRGMVREYHQVKRQQSNLGRWSLAAMESDRVLSRFWDKLQTDTSCQCHFVSTFAANELQELTENARSATDLTLFQQEFIGASQDRRNWFGEIRKYWGNCAEQEAYSALQRVFVRTMDEYSLHNDVEYRLATLVDAHPSKVAGLLSKYALDQIHHDLRAFDIWQLLESKGMRRREWNNDPHVLAAVAAQNDRYLEPLRRDAVAGSVIPRSEVTQVAAILESAGEKQGVMISGEAGVGKSGIGLQIADYMKQRGWPVLAFRIDQLVTMQSPKDVGRQLELPESPITVLANLAQNKPALLVIDQLDAISKASGRNTHFFNCVAEMIEQAKLHPAMRVVLLCRKFDIANDNRLRKLTGDRGFATEVAVSRLDLDIVRNVATRLGLAAQSLTPRQLDLLSIPLHLKLLSEVADTEEVRALDFATANDLFKTFWNHKRWILTERIGHQVAWTQIIDTLCESMSRTRRLFAPKSLVEEHEADADAMASERVLVADGQQYRFFHETFFDYAFARRFVSTGDSLLSLLLAEEQHLFRRAQVRQILAYSRDADPDRYHSDVAELLSSANVRFHIKQVVFALLRQLSAPTPQEWEIIAPLVVSQDHPLYGEAWHLLAQPAWFRLAASLGVIEGWLTEEEARADQAVRLIGFVAPEAPDEVAALLEEWDATQENWRNRLRYVLSWAKLGKSRRLFDLFLTLLRQEGSEEVRAPIAANGDFWLAVYSLAEDQPEWYCEVLGAYFAYHLDFNQARGISNPFAPRYRFREVSETDAPESEPFPQPMGTIAETQYDHNIVSVAQKAPLVFAAQVFDFVLTVAERNAVREGSPPYQDTVWPWRYYGAAQGIADSLLWGLEIALGQVAASSPEQFVPYATRLRTSDTQTAQYLLVRAYTANGQRFADEAAAYLCERPERFHTGWMDEGHWASRLLLEAITPHCSDGNLKQLGDAVMGYYTDYERSAKSYKKGYGTAFGYYQFVLLNGIVSERRSQSLQRQLEEWRRKFRRQDGDPAQGIRGGFVGPPISIDACQRMTDAQWLTAIAEYDSEQTRWSRDPMVGGAHQLSYQLEAKTKQEPIRFAELMLRFPVTTHLAYFEAVVRGLGSANDDIEIAVKVCRFCHSLPGRPCGRWITDPIKRLGQQQVPDELLDMVVWYATEATDPLADGGSSDVRQRETELEFKGINSVRGAATIAIADLMFDDRSRTEFFMPALKRLVQDPSPAVRTCAVTALTAALNADRDVAVQLFLRLVEGTDDTLLATGYVDNFLHYALHTHLEELTPLLERMLTSSEPKVAEAGAVRACLIALSHEEALPLVQRCLTGSVTQRKGAATIFTHNISGASNRILCEEALIAFFSDESAQVREAASRCFQNFKEDSLKDFTKLVDFSFR